MDMPARHEHHDDTLRDTGKNLLLLSLATIALCAYQWIELHAISSGGTTPLCAISAAINCAAVWEAPLSRAVIELTGIPLAGWGLAWGALVLALTVMARSRHRRARAAGVPIRALQLASAAAVGVCVLLLAYSIGIAVFCPTCLIFYLFAGVTAYMTMRTPGGNNATWLRATGLSVAVLVPIVAVVFAISLWLSRSTFADTVANGVASDTPLARFLESQPKDLQQYLSNALAEYRSTAPDNRPVDAKRVTWGNADAPVRVAEWVEIRCSHCRDLHRNLEQLTAMLPPEAWNVETHFFPLDSACNSAAQRSPGNGVSCLAAKLLICLAGEPQEGAVRAALFQNQPQLTTTSRIWEIAGAHGVVRDKVQSCVDAPGTAKTLQHDIELALRHRIDGTPLVVINGRKTVALPHLILALIMSGGNADDPAFKVLPPPETKPAAGQ